MINDKKYKIMTSIESDAPFGAVNWCTISFITPSKNEDSNFLDVIGFKIHGGFNTAEQASYDSEKIRKRDPHHDVYMVELGKLYPWDDATKTDNIKYSDDKLNEMERTRKESIDKIKLINEQFVNEYKLNRSDKNSQNCHKIKERFRKKLLDKGLISKQEFDMINSSQKSEKLNKKNKLKKEEMKIRLQECIDSKTDYLDENPPIGLKYGCMTIFSPKHIYGLKSLCFKIRGLFQTQEQLIKRINKLKILYPDDKIYSFEVGKWCPISENESPSHDILEKQLNFAMKCHIDSLDKQNDEFEKRKEKLQNITEQENKVTKRNNKLRKESKLDDDTVLLGTKEDEEAVLKLLEYLEDPELSGKFAVDKDKLTTVEVNV